MKPAITILDYLWSVRKTLLKHDNEECSCPFEKVASEYIENSMVVGMWAEVVVINDMPTLQMIRMAADDWDELCGPKAQDRQLQEILEAHMEQVSQIIALQASKARLSSE